jgi:predicted nucleic acid-binding protein
MPASVVDASAIAALLFGEPLGADVAERLADSALAAPVLLGFEVSSVCRKKALASPRDADRLLAARSLLDRMGIQLFDVDHEQVIRLALERSVTVYDAAYLWLAHRLGAELVTLDQDLARALARG